MKDYSSTKQLVINLSSGVIVFFANVFINFFLSPFIVQNIGVEANGFVALANNFINYATLLVTVINSMAGRFITIEIHRGNVKKANTYYTSVFYANLLLLAIFVIPAVIMILNLEKIIDIPPAMEMDVKLLFAFIFSNFLAGLAIPMWASSTYITNKLYITSLGTIISNLIRVVSIVGLFMFFEPKVWCVGLSSLLVMIFTKIWNFIYKRKLTPELIIARKSFDIKAVLELMASGVWNAISSLGVILLSGLDLLISNLFIGSVGMGMLSIVKIVPNFWQTLASTICNVFAPELTINFAKNEKDKMKQGLKRAMNITGIILTIPLAGLFVFGEEFFRLWMPSQNATQLQILSTLTLIGYIFTAGIYVLYNVFSVVNKVRTNAILLILSGVVSTAIVFVLLNTTNLGIYAIAGVSSLVNIVRNMCYTVPFVAKYCGFKWYTFFPQVGKSILSVLVIMIVGYGVKLLIIPTTWFMLVVAAIITAVIGFAINIFIVLSKDERNHFVNIVKSKLNI